MLVAGKPRAADETSGLNNRLPLNHSPQRHRGGSPLSQHTTTSNPLSTATYASYRPCSPFGRKTKEPTTMSARNAPMTAQPCQQVGTPQPQPYRLAGNQYLRSVDTRAFLNCGRTNPETSGTVPCTRCDIPSLRRIGSARFGAIDCQRQRSRHRRQDVGKGSLVELECSTVTRRSAGFSKVGVLWPHRVPKALRTRDHRSVHGTETGDVSGAPQNVSNEDLRDPFG